MSLNVRTIKLASITQNNHVYEHTAEGLTPEILLNIRSPYRRQKRDLSIIRSSFRRPHIKIEIPAIILSLPFSRSHRLFPTFLLSCDHIDYFLSFYLLTITSTISYFFTFLRSYRLFPIFLPSCGHTDYNLYSLSQLKPR